MRKARRGDDGVSRMRIEPLDDAGTNPPKQRRRLLDSLIVVAVVALALTIVLPSLSRRKSSPFRDKCHKQLRAIGQAMMLYANEHSGRYPADAGELIVDQDITT